MPRAPRTRSAVLHARSTNGVDLTISVSDHGAGPTPLDCDVPVPVREPPPGDKIVSDPFEVVSGWQIQWQTDGASLAIAVTGDQNLGVIVDEPGPASGVTSLAPHGRIFVLFAINPIWGFLLALVAGTVVTALVSSP